MCLTCNPYCGRCRPPERKVVQCSQCGEKSALSREECIIYLGYKKGDRKKDLLKHGEHEPHCEFCSADILEDLKAAVIPKDCVYMDITCGYPCGRQVAPRRVGDANCAKPVPLKKVADKVASD